MALQHECPGVALTSSVDKAAAPIAVPHVPRVLYTL